MIVWPTTLKQRIEVLERVLLMAKVHQHESQVSTNGQIVPPNVQ